MIQRSRRAVQLIGILAIASIWLLYQLFSPPRYRREDVVSDQTVRLRDEADYILSKSSWGFDAPPTTRRFQFVISDVEARPDGVLRPMILINGLFPGPVIRGNEGDTIVVDVENRASNSTSIHWHGILQNATNWMDGATGVTNCGIPPGGSFSYQFTVDKQYGTYWYHAHLSTTRIDGVFGPIVIHSRTESELNEYDTDAIIMIQDYYHDLSAALLPGYLSPGNQNDEPTPDGALINGRNIIDCNLVPSGRHCDSKRLSLAAFQLDSEKTHRLRFINVGAFAGFEVEIDEHELSLIEVDGEAVHPYTVNRFPISVAQRYSFLISKPESAASSFWLRARMLPHCFANLDLLPHVNLEVRARIHYTNDDSPPSSTALPASSQLICKDLNLTSVVPVNPSPLPETSSELIYLRANFEIGEYQLSRGFINDTSFRPSHTSNILHSLLSGSKSPPRDSSGMIITKNAQTVVDIVIDNFDDGSHPFHLHGYRVWVLGYGDGYFSYQHPEIMASLNRPERVVRRDTVTIEPYHWVAVRVILDNPGVWMLHCHTAWHLEAGMAAVMVVDGLKVASWKGSESKPAEDGCGVNARQKWPGVMDEVWTSRQWGKS